MTTSGHLADEVDDPIVRKLYHAQLEAKRDDEPLSPEPDLSGRGYDSFLTNATTTTKPSSISGSDASVSVYKKVHFQTDEEKPEAPEETFPFPPPPPPPPPPEVELHSIPMFDQVPPPPPPPSPPAENLYSLDPFHPTIGPDGTPRLNKAAIRVYTRFMDELAEFVGLQGQIISTRVETQVMRARLKNSRKNVSKCDMEFIDYLRLCIAQGTTTEDLQLQELYQAAQTARDEVGPLEDDYEDLEIRLGAREFELKEKYVSLESRYQNFFKIHAASTTMAAPSSIEFEDPSESSNAESREHEEQHPRDYSLFHGATIGESVKVGQLPLAVDVSANFILGNTPTQRANLSGAIASSEVPDSSRQKGVPRSAGEFPELGSLDDIYGLEDPPLNWDSVDARTQGFQEMADMRSMPECPELLDELDTMQEWGDGNGLLLRGTDTDTQSTLSGYLMNFDSTRDRVNRWMLHKLRVSPWEVFELQRRVAASSRDVPDWTTLALRLWEDDPLLSDVAQSRKSQKELVQGQHQESQATHSPYPDAIYASSANRRSKKYRASLSSNLANPADISDVSDVPPHPDPCTHRFETISGSAF